jgi:5-methyltetrahydropteroyltriglutamate--homocysteine methyltransferase
VNFCTAVLTLKISGQHFTSLNSGRGLSRCSICSTVYRRRTARIDDADTVSKLTARYQVVSMTDVMISSTLGYPRIGADREMKKSLEQYWAGVVSEAALLGVSEAIEAQSVSDQASAGIDLIGVGDHTLYDHVLDWTFRLGCVPERFQGVKAGLDTYFAMARGVDGAPALDMSKFFGTNYHYLVPEFSDKTSPTPNFKSYLTQIRAAQNGVGPKRVAPIVLGPVTLVCIAKLNNVSRMEMLAKLIPAYVQLCGDLAALSVPEVQIHEPALVLGEAATLRELFVTAYTSISQVSPPIHIATYFDSLSETVLPWVLELPGLTALSLDFTRGDNVKVITKCGFPSGIRLGAGIVDGRSVWADSATAPLLQEIRSAVGTAVAISVQPSCSLQYVPLDLELEPDLPKELKANLAFARQKLAIINAIATGHARSSDKADIRSSVESSVLETITEEMFLRTPGFDIRRPQQFTVPGGFGTNTIGSFPQTSEIRKLRVQKRKGTITEKEYDSEIDKYIAHAIKVQETLGLDVFVHGEPERTDMVEYFGQHLDGFAFTSNGWVQSYGSRYVRPPIIHSDVKRTGPLTVREFKVAQSMTSKPVKGMLTAATTIINWSFPRKDISREIQAYQIGLALRGEVADLEAAGCKIIQVDDPALREGLPLKEKDWPEYLRWAVRAFRLSTSGVHPSTQIFSHLCYADFEDILPAIDDMDVDVLTVENSRSGDEMLRAFGSFGYKKDIGPGVYDIHSPVIPPEDVMMKRVKLFKECGLAPERIWINPDCGLKTRKWDEVIPALANMVAIARRARAGEVN